MELLRIDEAHEFLGLRLNAWVAIVVFALALLAWRITAVRKMVLQYPWRYERTSLFAYREKAGA